MHEASEPVADCAAWPGIASPERLRLLAAIGGGLVHELANRIGACTGMAEDASRRLPLELADPLLRTAAGAREALSLLRSVVRLLERDPRATGVGRLGDAVVDVVALMSKHAQRTRCSVQSGSIDEDLRVRIDGGDLLQTIGCAVLFALHGGDGAVVVSARRHVASRKMAAVVIEGSGPREPYERLAIAIARDDPACVAALRSVPGSSDALLIALATLRCCGGDLAVSWSLEGRRSLCLLLPEVGGS